MLRSTDILRPGVIALLLALTPILSAQSQGTTALTNGDIVKMVRAGLSTSIVLSTIESNNLAFDLSPSALIALKEAGVDDAIIEAMQKLSRARASGETTNAVSRTAPEKSDLLAGSKDPQFILRNFRTVLVDASRANYFGTPQLKAALGQNKDWAALGVAIVDDPAVADAVLEVGYTFAWDFPFSLKHQNTSLVLLSGKGSGPFSGPRGATSVAGELVKLLRPYRDRPAPAPR